MGDHINCTLCAFVLACVPAMRRSISYFPIAFFDQKNQSFCLSITVGQGDDHNFMHQDAELHPFTLEKLKELPQSQKLQNRPENDLQILLLQRLEDFAEDDIANKFGTFPSSKLLVHLLAKAIFNGRPHQRFAS